MFRATFVMSIVDAGVIVFDVLVRVKIIVFDVLVRVKI